MVESTSLVLYLTRCTSLPCLPASSLAPDRAFNFPHHCASYYNMYRVARYHDKLKTYQPWQWYLARAANTTIKFGAPSVGVMDGTLFREVLRSLQEEAEQADYGRRHRQGAHSWRVRAPFHRHQLHDHLAGVVRCDGKTAPPLWGAARARARRRTASSTACI